MAWTYGQEIKVGTILFRAFGPGPNFIFQDSDINLNGSTNLNINGSGAVTTFNTLVYTAADGTGSGVAGKGFTFTTGAGGGGNAQGGDHTFNLGAGTGNKRNGQVIINSTQTQAVTSPSRNAAVTVNAVLNPSGAIGSGGFQAGNYVLTVNQGVNINGSAEIEAFTAQTIFNATDDSSAFIYCAEFYNGISNTGSLTTGFTVGQFNIVGTGSGTSTTTSGIRVVTGPLSFTATNVVGVLVTSIDAANTGVITNFIGFESDIILSNNSPVLAGGLKTVGARSAVPSQGGNTSGINTNVGVWAAGAGQVSGAGIGADGGAGATVNNMGFYADLPNGTAAAGGTTNNYGFYVTGNGNAAATANFAFHNAGTAPSAFRGTLAIGTATGQTAISLLVSGSTPLTGTTQTGISITTSFQSTATSTARSLNVQFNSQATSFTITNGLGISVATPTPGAGTTVTTMTGISVLNQGISGTGTSYALSVAAQSGSTTNHGIYNSDDYSGPAGATGMTRNFIFIPAAAGTPTGVPANYSAGARVPLFYDSTNNFLYVYTGGAWKKSTVYA